MTNLTKMVLIQWPVKQWINLKNKKVKDYKTRKTIEILKNVTDFAD